MDKLITEEIITKRKRKLFFTIGILVTCLIIAVWMLRFFVKSTVKRSEIATAVVEVGNVENTINASGEILPEFEQVITSPINSSVQNVLIDAGTSIKPGQAILTLDKSSAEVEYEKQKFQLESKRNSIHKLKLELDKSFFDIQSNNEIKQLKINSLKASLEDTKRLYKAGGATKEDVAQAELNLKVAQLEKKQLENEIQNKVQTMKAEMKESELAAAIQENDLRELEKKLKEADIMANRSGVVTWVNKNIGASIREGETLARIADLKSFKVSGTIADSYLDQLHKGMQAIIRINDTKLTGIVTMVSPSVQNGLISFDVQLDERDNKLLRPNLKVDVFLVTESKTNVYRVSNGAAFKGSDLQEIFVVKGNKAERRTVHTGLSNFDYIEIKDNVKPGEVVITSNMSDYKNAKAITITN
ncbi:efflux RND transporter periplasmic adaptor subunit [Rubrolithibacter danxiaensis]|uniref:efflux RND transporter periplasmic adaptor subunit n=1 Tax=Rubrolithibacter danxiaensis TaxID=3390805 RepID=UPI003BF7A93B